MRTVRLLQRLYGANTTSRNKTEWIDYANKIGVEKMVKDRQCIVGSLYAEHIIIMRRYVQCTLGSISKIITGE